VYDSHIDTVGIGDPDSWQWDPFKGKVENGILYARGACDEKNSTPGMVYGLAFARELGLLEDTTAWYFGNMEEWCDGIAPNTFVEVDPGIRPDFVVIGEPTKMQVYRGHKGRVELKVTSTGRSAHAASHHLGDSALYKMLSVISGIRDLDAHLHTDPFLGKGTIMVTDTRISTASINAVPDGFTVFIDRRLTFGESKEQAVQQVKELIPGYLRNQITVEEMFYDDPSYTGFVFPVEKYYPPGRWKNRIRLCKPDRKRSGNYGTRHAPPASGVSPRTERTGRAKRRSHPSDLEPVMRFMHTRPWTKCH